MTFTRHGHHIPGTSTDDEAPNRKKARCGGPGGYGSCYLCNEDIMWHERDLTESQERQEEAQWAPFRELTPNDSRYFFNCVCGVSIRMFWNGGELDQDTCSCGRTYRGRHVLTIIEVKEPVT